MDDLNLVIKDHEGIWFYLSPDTRMEDSTKNSDQNIKNSPTLIKFMEWVDNKRREEAE